MAKRFLDSEIWKKKWFCDLSPTLKTFWIYVVTNCDASGVWESNIPLAVYQIGAKIAEDEILTEFHGNIVKLSDDKLFLPDFIKFQYGDLKEDHIPHRNVFKLLEKHGIIYPIDRLSIENIKVFDTPQYKEEDKDKDKEEEKERAKKQNFIIPAIEDVIEYFKISGFTQQAAEKFYNYYSTANWVDSKGHKIKNWKQKAIGVWFKDENKIETKGKIKGCWERPDNAKI